MAAQQEESLASDFAAMAIATRGTPQASSTMTLLDKPIDIILEIANHLDDQTIITLALTCRAMRVLLRHKLEKIATAKRIALMLREKDFWERLHSHRPQL